MRRTISALTLLMFALPVLSADLTVDGRLTVYDKAVFHGDIELKPPTYTVPTTDGLVLRHAYSSASMSVADLSGMGNGGIVNGATWISSGINGGAFSYDGVDDYIEIPDAPSLNVTVALTVSAWVMATAPADGDGWDGVITKGNFRDRLFGLQRSGSKITSIYMYGGVTRWNVVSADNICDGQWHHVVTTWNGQRVNLYVDGRESVNYNDPNTYGVNWNAPLVSITDPVWIGRISAAEDYPFQYFNDGAIDEVRLYNRALSPEEVMGLYLSDLGLANETPSAGGIVQVDSQAVNVFKGKVGIGKENPSEMLDIAGNLAVSGTISGNGAGLSALDGQRITVGTVGNAQIVNGSIGLSKLDQAGLDGRYINQTGDTILGNFSIYNGSAWIHTMDGHEQVNLALGEFSDLSSQPLYAILTNDDSDRLEIHSYRWGGQTLFTRGSPSGTTKNGMGLLTAETGTWLTLFGGDADNSSKIVLSSTSDSVFNGNGNVGIGTASPAAKLHVNGTAKFEQGINYVAPRGDLSMGAYTAGQ